ncbi:MAG: ankyrin repeat domain-containing protein [Mycoplasmoidaceae bacterium]
MKIEEEVKVLDEIFANETTEVDCEVVEITSKKPNIMWVINKDTLSEVKSHVTSNIFTQASVKISHAMYLAKIGKTEALYKLMKKDPSVINETTCNGRTALMFAAQFGNINCLNLLIVGGAHLDAQDEHGATALMLAAYFGQDEAVKVLLENGANKMLKDCNGVNAKMLAKKNDDRLIYELIDEWETIDLTQEDHEQLMQDELSNTIYF